MQLADELGDRLGHIGWKFTQIVHDDQRHPCELVEELAGADVLLTAYGFQVNVKHLDSLAVRVARVRTDYLFL